MKLLHIVLVSVFDNSHFAVCCWRGNFFIQLLHLHHHHHFRVRATSLIRLECFNKSVSIVCDSDSKLGHMMYRSDLVKLNCVHCVPLSPEVQVGFLLRLPPVVVFCLAVFLSSSVQNFC